MKILISERQFQIILKNILSEENVERGDWEPLYNFLSQIFEDKYLDVADGFMFMGKNEDKMLWFFKNGLTRKTLALDYDGNPYVLDWETKAPKPKSFLDAFNDVFDTYNELIKSMEDDGYKLSEKTKKDIYTMDYKEFMQWRDKYLAKRGYNVVNVKSPDDIPDFLKK